MNNHFDFMSVYYFNEQAPQRNPLVVITPGHSQPILSTGFEGDFSLTLGFCWATFSFSFLFICHLKGSVKQLLGKVAELTCFHCLWNLY